MTKSVGSHATLREKIAIATYLETCCSTRDDGKAVYAEGVSDDTCIETCLPHRRSDNARTIVQGIRRELYGNLASIGNRDPTKCNCAALEARIIEIERRIEGL